MPGKKVQCINCSAVMRSDNFKRHIKTCESRQSCPSGQTSYQCLWKHKKGLHPPKHKEQIVIRNKPIGIISGNEYADQQPGDNQTELRNDIANYTWCDDATLDLSSDESRDTESSIYDIPNYSWCDDGAIKKNHSFQLPRDIRAIIVGKSGSGKTTLLCHLLMAPDVLDYNNLMVCGKSLHQPSYKIMQLGFKKGLSKTQIGKIFIRQGCVMEDGGPEKVINDYSLTCKGGVDASFFDDVTRIPDPREHDASRKNLLVLDDVMLCPQNKVEAYFTRGRHNNVDVIYITQSYFRLPRQTIRENGNLFIFFKQDRKNLIHIYNDHCAGDGVPFISFSNFCNNVWRENPHNFVTINLSKTVGDGKYRKNLNGDGLPINSGIY